MPYINELVRRKREGPEKAALGEADLTFHESEYLRLRAALEAAFEASALPEVSTAGPQLDAMLVRLRLRTTNHEA